MGKKLVKIKPIREMDGEKRILYKGTGADDRPLPGSGLAPAIRAIFALLRINVFSLNLDESASVIGSYIRR